MIDILDGHRDGLRFHILEDDETLSWKIAERRQEGVPDEWPRQPLPALESAVALCDTYISGFVAVDTGGRLLYCDRASELLDPDRAAERAIRFRALHSPSPPGR